LSGRQIEDIDVFTYLQFIVPGLTMMSEITNSYMNVCSSFFSTKFQRSVEELLVSPTSEHVIILGYAAGGVARGLCVGSVVLALSVFFTSLPVMHFTLLWLFAFLTATLFAIAGLLNAIFARKFDDISIIPTFVLTPLTYLGGVFYSLEQLSPSWQLLSKLNPILYMVNGFRYGFLGRSDVDLGFACGMLVFFVFLFYGVTWILIRRGVGLRN
ncbi:MAG: ABC transporter permease, partial [Zetaproteobacteria bacterium]|nr:ABC transporter permease [Zetaproteobacteria bacterium]